MAKKRGTSLETLVGRASASHVAPVVALAMTLSWAREGDAQLVAPARATSTPTVAAESSSTGDRSCHERGEFPSGRVVLVDSALGAAVVRGADGALRVVERGDVLETTAATPCSLERFHQGSLDCSEPGVAGRLLRAYESVNGQPSKVDVISHCEPETQHAPSTQGDRPPP